MFSRLMSVIACRYFIPFSWLNTIPLDGHIALADAFAHQWTSEPSLPLDYREYCCYEGRTGEKESLGKAQTQAHVARCEADDGSRPCLLALSLIPGMAGSSCLPRPQQLSGLRLRCSLSHFIPLTLVSEAPELCRPPVSARQGARGFHA